MSKTSRKSEFSPVPLEPRLMMDGNLSFDLSDSTALTSSISGIAQAFEEQYSSVSALFSDFSDDAQAVSALIEAMGSEVKDNASLNPIVEAVGRVDDAFEGLRDQVEARLTSLLSSAHSGLTTQLDAIPGSSAITQAEVETLFSVSNFLDGTIGADIDAFVTAKSLGSADAVNDAFKIVTALASDTFSIALTNISDGAGGDLISFADNAGKVTVSFSLPEIVTDFTSVVSGKIPGLDFGTGLNSASGGTDLFSFDIAPIVEVGGSFGISKIGFNADNIQLAPLVQLGGNIDIGSAFDVRLGLLDFSVTSIEVLEYQLGFDFGASANLGAEVTVGASPSFDVFADGLSFDVSQKVKDFGATEFTEIADDTHFNFLAVEMTAGLTFGGSTKSIDAGLSLGSILKSSTAVDLASQAASVLENLEFGLELDTSGLGLTGATAEAIEKAVQSLVALDAEDIGNFLVFIEELVTGFLSDASLDVQVPFTEISTVDLVNEVRATFSTLIDKLAVSNEALGFVGGEFADVISQVETEQAGAVLTSETADVLAGYKSFDLTVIDSSGQSATKTITLTGTDVVDTGKTVDQRLTALASLIETEIGVGISLAVAGGALTATSTGVGAKTFGISRATKLDDVVDSAFGLQNLGFNLGQVQNQLLDYADSATDIEGDDFVLRINNEAVTSMKLGDLDVDALTGIEEVSYTFLVDGVETILRLEKDGGWATNQDLVDSLQAELDAKGLNMAAALDGSALKLETVAKSLGSFNFSSVGTSASYDVVIDGVTRTLAVSKASGWASQADFLTSLQDEIDAQGLGFVADVAGGVLELADSRPFEAVPILDSFVAAPTFEKLIEFVTTELGKILPGALLELSDAGEMIFRLEGIEGSASIGVDDNVRLDLDDFGVGGISGLSLGGNIEAELAGSLNAAIGIDLGALADILTAGAPTTLAAAEDLGSDLFNSLLQAVFVEDIGLSATIDAAAKNITGEADLGLLKIELGKNDASKNGMAVSAGLEIGFVGLDSELGYNDRISFEALRNLAQSSVAVQGPLLLSTPSAGIASLLGTLDLAGRITVDGEGHATTNTGDAISDLTQLNKVDLATYAGTDPLAQMIFQIGDVSVSTLGIEGINEGIIDGISFTIQDLSNPLDTFDYALLGDGADALDSIKALSSLGTGDILDSLTAIANLLEVTATTLKDTLPFLEAEIPVLNFSILDSLDFATDFLTKLQEIRNNPQSALDEVKNQLEDVFGQDTVTLSWNGDDKVLDMGLSFKLLEDVAKNIPFQIDLAQILADQLSSFIPEELLGFVSGFVDASGSGNLKFDPLLSLDFAFGLDLAPLLATPTDLAAGTTKLEGLSSVSSIVQSDGGGADFSISLRDNDTGTVKDAELTIDSALTLEEQIAAINATLATSINATTQMVFDPVTGIVGLADSASVTFDNTGVQALFGADTAQSSEVSGVHELALAFADPGAGGVFELVIGSETIIFEITEESGRDAAGLAAAINSAAATTAISRAVLGGNVLVLDQIFDTADESEATAPFVVAFEPGAIADFAAAQTFDIPVAGGLVSVDVEAEVGRSEEDLIEATNNAILSKLGELGLLTGTATPGISLNLTNLISAFEDGGVVKLRATNFATASGYDATSFSVQGLENSPDQTLSFTELNGSNAMRLLGFASSGSSTLSTFDGEALYEAVDRGAPRVFIDTAKSGIAFDFIAGVDNGLNLSLGLGPIAIQVVDGKALLNSGDGTGGPAHLGFKLNDIDGDDNDGQYDVAHLASIRGDEDVDFTQLLEFDVQIGINIDLPFGDTLGIFDSTKHGLKWQTEMLAMVDGASWADIDFSNLSATLTGELPNIFDGTGIDFSKFELNLPDIGDFISSIDVLALLNDPRVVLGGIDDIMGEIDDLFGDYLEDINLPIIGDAIGSGVTFFNDMRNNVIQPALAYANTPLADGSMPTSVDLITGFLNDQLNAVLGTTDATYLHAHLETGGSISNAYLYGAINFSGEIFREEMDIDFDFGLPGLNIEVEEGSEILMALDYTVNIGFGLDRNGFFLLNDTDQAEIGIEFLVDAGTFEGSMSVLNLMGVAAEAVTLDADGNVVSSASDGGGTAKVTAFLEADLYGEDGLEIKTGDSSNGKAVESGGIFRNYDEIKPLDGKGNILTYERVVYLNNLSFASLIEFDFGADVEVYIGLTGNILNPLNGDPLTVNDFQIFPDLRTELVLDAGYTFQDGLNIESLGFQNVRIDAGQLFDTLVRPITDPIIGFVEPIMEVISFIFEPPIGLLKDLAVDVLAIWFPIARLINNIANIAVSIAEFTTTLAASGGQVQFGDFDLTKFGSGLSKGNTSAASIDLSTVDVSGIKTATSKPGFGTFGKVHKGFSVDIPLIKDPFSAMSALLGDLGGIELIRARYTLFNIDTASFDITQPFIDMLNVDMPGWATKVIESAIAAKPPGITSYISGRGVTKFEVGYDMSGIEAFINTFDPLRLLDGAFIDAKPGSLIDLDVDIGVTVGAGVAGVSGGGEFLAQLALNDPNEDGKLRIAEIVNSVVEVAKATADASNPLSAAKTALGYLFDGKIGFGVDASWYAGFLKGDLFSYDLGEVPLGIFDTPPDLSSSPGGGTTAALGGALGALGIGPTGTEILNVGAKIVDANSTDHDEDGDDILKLGSSGDGFSVSLSTHQGSLTGDVDSSADAIIIPAGEGDNVIDMSDFADADSDRVTITYTGSGTDTIMLPKGGINVAFLGAGDDTVTGPADGQGTYIIFAEHGADVIDIPSGNVMVFAGKDYGMRDIFLQEFAQGGASQGKVLEFLGLNSDGTVNAAGEEFFNIGEDEFVNLATLIERFTEVSQGKAHRDVETITVGSGNHVIFTGKGDDTITGDLNGSGEVIVLAGRGDDAVTIGGSDVYVEGGSGSDVIVVNGAKTEVWGWGKAAGERGALETTSEINALSQKDGNDIIIGGTGQDSFYGQVGDDLLEGNAGDDALFGGLGDDLLTGGTFILTNNTGTGSAQSTAEMVEARASSAPAARSASGPNTIEVADLDLDAPLNGTLTVSLVDQIDGADEIAGGEGDDVGLGGGGKDTLRGDNGNDILVGDFAELLMSGNFVAQVLTSNHLDSGNQGTDTIDGGKMDDILVAGAGDAGTVENLTDLYGNNLLVGDFGYLKGGRLNEAQQTINSIDHINGGQDNLLTGRGHDKLVGGEAGDTASSGLGVDMIFGDNVRFDYAGGSIVTSGLDTDGDDTIITGVDNNSVATDGAARPDQNDFAIAGLGEDTLTAGTGGLTAMGDTGWVTLSKDSLRALENFEYPGDSAPAEDLAKYQDQKLLIDGLFEEAQTVKDARDGDDILTVKGGENIVMLAGGDDTATLEDGINYILGDDGNLKVSISEDRTTKTIEITAGDLDAGNDTLIGKAGQDILVGGFGEETIYGGDGQDFLIGDTIILKRIFKTDGTNTTGELYLDTNFAYVTGGYDELHGDAGFDVMIGNLGPDIFYGDTANDALFSDGFAGFFSTDDLKNLNLDLDVIPFWDLERVNFAGPSAVDLVSSSQSSSSIGLSLDRTVEGVGDPTVAPELRGLGNVFVPNSDLIQVGLSNLTGLVDFILSESVRSSLAEMISLGLDDETLRAAVLTALEEYVDGNLDLDPSLRAMVLDMIMEIFEERLDLETDVEAANNPGTFNENGTFQTAYALAAE